MTADHHHDPRAIAWLWLLLALAASLARWFR
jgi:MYXO-CTERM domain-containing protein